MLKRLLTLTLVFSLVCGTNTEMSSAWWWKEESQNPANTCEKMNKCGQYKDINCAIAEGKNLLQARNNYIRYDKVGQNCEYDLRFWDYVQIGRFSNLMSKELQKAKEDVAFNEILRNVTASIKSIFYTDDEISEKIALYWAANSRFVNLNQKNINVEKTAKDKKNNKMKWTGGIGAIGLIGSGIAAWCFPPAGFAMLGHVLLTGGAAVAGGAVTAGITDAAISTVQSSNEFKESRKSLIEVRNYASVIEDMLYHIEKGNWKAADSILAQINSDPKSYEGIVSMLKSKIDYSKDEKNEFKNCFKALGLKLKDILDKHKLEGWN